MNASILDTIKMMLGPGSDDSFDGEILVGINSAITVLTQLGIPAPDGFLVTGSSETWEQYLGSDPRTGMIKTYIYLKTKIGFDPPTSSVLMQAIKDQIAEYEWRICNPEKEE